MLTCPTCLLPFDGAEQFCPRDGTPLMPSVPKDQLLGRLLGGRYRLDERIGQGAMGTVYRAMHVKMEKPVAVKVLRSEVSGDSDSVARFHREARLASRLDSEHCVKVIDFAPSGDLLLYLVLELCDGESLGDLVARGPVPSPLAAAICLEVSEALRHAHEHGVIHRDLKPDNVFLVRTGQGPTARTLAKVLDFGLAKFTHESSLSLTSQGAVFGTPEYMAPEQAQGDPPDARTDLYAVGVMLYQLLCGELPFRAGNFLALLAKQVDELPVPPRQRRPDLEIPEEIEAVVMRLLEKAPARRFQSADELARALTPLADKKLLSSLALPEPSKPPPAPSRALAVESPRDPFPVEPSRVATLPARTIAGAGASTAQPVEPAPAPAGDHESSDDDLDDFDEYPDDFDDAPVAAAAAGDPAKDDPFKESGAIEASASPPRARRWLVVALALVVFAPVAALVGRRPFSLSTVEPVRVADPLAEARRLLGIDDLEGADRLLTDARTRADGSQLQLLLGELALRRGNRLGAMAHFHRATRLSPSDADAHARLASLLLLIGQGDAACREGRAALGLDPRNSVAVAATARCPKP